MGDSWLELLDELQNTVIKARKAWNELFFRKYWDRNFTIPEDEKSQLIKRNILDEYQFIRPKSYKDKANKWFISGMNVAYLLDLCKIAERCWRCLRQQMRGSWIKKFEGVADSKNDKEMLNFVRLCIDDDKKPWRDIFLDDRFDSKKIITWMRRFIPKSQASDRKLLEACDYGVEAGRHLLLKLKAIPCLRTTDNALFKECEMGVEQFNQSIVIEIMNRLISEMVEIISHNSRKEWGFLARTGWGKGKKGIYHMHCDIWLYGSPRRVDEQIWLSLFHGIEKYEFDQENHYERKLTKWIKGVIYNQILYEHSNTIVHLTNREKEILYWYRYHKMSAGIENKDKIISMVCQKINEMKYKTKCTVEEVRRVLSKSREVVVSLDKPVSDFSGPEQEPSLLDLIPGPAKDSLKRIEEKEKYILKFLEVTEELLFGEGLYCEFLAFFDEYFKSELFSRKYEEKLYKKVPGNKIDEFHFMSKKEYLRLIEKAIERILQMDKGEEWIDLMSRIGIPLSEDSSSVEGSDLSSGKSMTYKSSVDCS